MSSCAHFQYYSSWLYQSLVSARKTNVRLMNYIIMKCENVNEFRRLWSTIDDEILEGWERGGVGH